MIFLNLLNLLVKNKDKALKKVLLRPQTPDDEYHELAFEIFVEMIGVILAYPMLFEPRISRQFIQSLNEALKATSDLELLASYYEHLVSIVEKKPKQAAYLVNNLDLWKNMISYPFDKIA